MTATHGSGTAAKKKSETTPAPSQAWNRQARPDAEPRVGLLLPLSGANAGLGRAMLNAAQVAVQDVADQRFVLMSRDTHGTPDGARAAAKDVLDKGAGLIIGPLLAASTRAVKDLARERGVNVISFSSDETVAGDGVFVMGFLPRAQVDRVVGYAVHRGALRIAVLAPATEYGRLVADETQRAASRSAGIVTKTAFYDPGAKDYSDVVRSFAEYGSRSAEERKKGLGLSYDAVMLPEGGLKLLQLVPLLPYYDVDPDKVMYLGTGLWDSPVVHQEPNLVGGLFAAPPPDARADFEAKYTASFGEKPPRLATLAYDGTALAALLAKEPGGPNFSTDAITAANGFVGADGLLRFLPSGIAERGLAVLRIEKDGFSVVDPPIRSFTTAATQ